MQADHRQHLVREASSGRTAAARQPRRNAFEAVAALAFRLRTFARVPISAMAADMLPDGWPLQRPAGCLYSGCVGIHLWQQDLPRPG